MSEGKKFKFPKLKISIFQEGADKKVAGYRALIILLGFIILLLAGKAYGNSIKSGEVSIWGKETQTEVSIPEEISGESGMEVKEVVQTGEGDSTNSTGEAVHEDSKEESKGSEQGIIYDRTDFEKVEKVYQFTQTYGGSRIGNEFFNELKRQCESDPELLRTVVAISVSESGMGKALPNRQSNFWGWFKGGSKNYDPTKSEMAYEICNGVRKYYMGIGNDMSKVIKYTGNSKPTSWLSNYRWAYNQMEVE